MSHRAFIISAASITGILFLASFLSSTRTPSTQKVKADQAQIAITMNPASGTLSTDPQTINVIIQPVDEGNTISGIYLTFKASGTLKILDVSQPEPFPEGNTAIFSQITKDVSFDRARMSYVVTLPDDELPNAIKIQVIVSTHAVGAGRLTIDTSSLQIVGHIPGYIYGYDSVDSAQFNGSAPESGEKSVTLKVRFQGVSTLPLHQDTEVFIKTILTDAEGEDFEYEIPVKPIGQGIWMGNVPIDAPVGEGYTIRIKGAVHVQKKAPVMVSIENKENNIDLSNTTLLAGDIQGDDKKQDGVIDSIDISYIRSHLGSTTPEILKTADLNFDGVVDTQDYSLMISSLQQNKTDEN